MDFIKQIEQATEYIKKQSAYRPTIGMILGSGLGPLADHIDQADKLPYGKIPHFPVSTVEGHAGQLVLGKLNGQTVVAMQGRFHFYEGYSLHEVTFPVRVLKELGIEKLIVTNACGALNPDFDPGDLMFISDHINFMGSNPLIGDNDARLGPRFPDMSSAYDAELRQIAETVAKEQGIKTRTGIYTAVSGPYYFSRAELRMVSRFGSDTIGMSTVPEVIVAVHTGLKVLGISCITDKADPDQHEPPDHHTVVEMALRTQPVFIKLVRAILEEI